MEAEVDPQLEVVVVQKTGVHEQCVANDHVYDNIGLEGDSVDYSRYNKVVGKHHRDVWGSLRVPRQSHRG